MEITLKSKHLIIAVIIILIALSGFWGYRFYTERQYLKKAQELETNIIIVSSLTEEVTNEYSEIWRKRINAGYFEDINVDGENIYFADFTEAVKYKMNKMEEAGFLFVIDSLSNSISNLMRSISPPPTKYNELHSTLTSLYADCNEYISLTKSPDGSLMSFNLKKVELSTAINRKVDEINTILPEQTDLIEKLSAVKLSIFAKQQKKGLDKQKVDSENKEKRLLQFLDYKKDCENFLATNAKKTGVITTKSGLQYEILKKGKGAIPSESDKVKVHYHGITIDGKVIDSSIDRKTPEIFKVTEVISGLREALKLMPVGSIYKLYIPQELAYGIKEQDNVKPYSMLIFEVRLLSIE